MEVLLDMPKDFAAYLMEYGFDAFYHTLKRKVIVVIDPSNARELQRLGQVIDQVEV